MRGVVGVESRENEKEQVMDDALSDASESANDSEETKDSEREDASNGEEREESVENDEPEKDGQSGEREEKEQDEEGERKKLEAELAEMQDRTLRVQADFENFRKRVRAEQASDAKYRVQPLAEELLPVLDNFERALSVEVTNEESKSILTGVDMVYRQLVQALEAVDVKEIQAQNEPFDPYKHQAVMQEQSEEHEPGSVMEVLQKGYMLKDRVIRPAMVKVNE